MITNIFPSLSGVGAPAQHELVSDDAQGEVVDLYPVILSAHHLWGHVAGRSRGIMCIIRCPNSGNTHVGDPNIAIALQEQILRLDVPVDNPVIVHVFEANQDASDKKLGLFLSKALFLVMVVSEIASSYQVSHQVDVLEVGECVKHIY